ncbi:MAG: ATP-dependent Clp protease ATP-binding subunit [bacterium]
MESLKTDETLVSLYGDALDFAQKIKESLNTFHFLLSFFTTPSEVTVLFEDLKINIKTITDSYKSLKNKKSMFPSSLEEPSDTLPSIENSAKNFLNNKGDAVSSVHFLCAMLNARDSIAYKILENINVLSDIRTASYNMLSTPTKRIKDRQNDLNRKSSRLVSRQNKHLKETKKQPEKLREEKTENSSGSSIREKEVKNTKNYTDETIIEKYGRNLTRLAKEGAIEKIFGRSRELETILDILGRKKNNNPLITGPAGTGKTSLVEGIACKQKDGLLSGRIIWEINLSNLLSGTEFRGSLEKRIDEIVSFVLENKNTLIVFIDEIHMINTEDNKVFANMLKPFLSRGDFPLIGATTTEEFKRHIARDPAFERRFSVVEIEEPEGSELFTITINAAESLSDYHGVFMNDRHTIESAIKLSNRYIAGKHQPDKVLSLLDTVGSVMQRANKKVVSDRDMLEIVSARTGIPLENLFLEGSSIMSLLPKYLDKYMTGQEIPKKKIVRLLARRFNRKTVRKPLASFVFAGPTGVGKTEMARRLAEFFFGSENKMISFDMSEFQEQHSVSKLIGAPPGYTGYEEGGRLTESFRRQPYQLLLLDEIEKAHPKVLTILLQLLEEGRVSDTRGFSVRMNEAIVVMTTNLGADVITEKRVGFGETSENSPRREYSRVLDKIDSFMSSELLNRVDEVVVFTSFSEEELLSIAEVMIKNTITELSGGLKTTLNVRDCSKLAEAVVSLMTSRDKNYGARAVKRIVERHVEGRIMETIYGESEIKALDITVDNGSISVK